MTQYKVTYSDEYLAHHGIKGQKWGIRRFQNEDGSYTPQGQSENKGHGRYYSNIESKDENKRFDYKKIAKVGASIAVATLATYGAYSIYKDRNAIKSFIGIGTKSINFSKMADEKIYFKVNDLVLDENDREIANSLKSTLDPNGILKDSGTFRNAARSMQGVNPSEEKNHCQQNVVVACLRYMGLDAKTKAGAWSDGGGSIVRKCFKGYDDEIKVRTPRVIFKTSQEAANWIIKRCRPVEGSCGSISLKLAPGISNRDDEGHAIMWYMENGNIKFCDPFARKPGGGYTMIEDASYYFGRYFSSTDEHPLISRLDNREINFEEFDKYFDH